MIDHYDLYAVHILSALLSAEGARNLLASDMSRYQLAHEVYDMVDSMYAVRKERKDRK